MLLLLLLLVWLSERGRSDDVTLDTHRNRTRDADLRLPPVFLCAFGSTQSWAKWSV